MHAGQGIEESDDLTNFIGAQHAPNCSLDITFTASSSFQ
jgi:hypothetical protein